MNLNYKTLFRIFRKNYFFKLGKHLIILYVSDQKRSRDFYVNLFGIEPELDVNGMTIFHLGEFGLNLGIIPEDGIREILGNSVSDPASGNGIPRCELYLYVNNPDDYFDKALKLNALPVSIGQTRNWGEFVSYVSDQDGHILAFAKKI